MKTVKLTRPLVIGDEKIKEIKMDLENLTGETIMKIDAEMRLEGEANGITEYMSQDFFLRMASKASNIHIEDLKRLNWRDFGNVLFSVRNFLLGLSELEEVSEPLDESTGNLEEHQRTE